ncbi:hypothetical protein [Actinomadura opuntiae]|uniref:hypothetical protein n=1 Tax=Actinomadura sp. OS1-43 TaxID=604315 RepID=UPI00255AA0A2|nr:hypothetical protein [Actinomadura sp. OS1-43]MDL4817328.1 hypothetical protein [Actinomadura sp. OS1-43]
MKITLRSAAIAANATCLAMALTACGSGSDNGGSGSGTPSDTVSSPASGATPSASGGAPNAHPGSEKPVPGGGSGSAVKLQVTAALRRALADAYFAKVSDRYPGETRAKVSVPANLYYGKVGGKYYAIGDIGFGDNPVSRQGGPHVWDRGATDWEYEGDTGGAVCSKVPARLVHVWGASCG